MGRFADAWHVLTTKDTRRSLPPSAGRRPGRARAYEGAALGRADGWLGSGNDPVNEIGRDLVRLRMRSRDLVQNNPYARRIVDAFANAIVASGIRPTVNTGDPDLDARVYALWDAWGRAPVPGSRMTIYGVQRLLCRAWMTDGEALLRFRPRYKTDMPGMPPLKLQPVEADLLPTDKTEAVGLNRIYSGIEFDPLGEVVRYHMLREHPGAALPFGGVSYDTIPVAASQVVHLFRPERPGQVRGVPVLAPVILSLWDLAGYGEAIRVGTRAAATLVATVTGGDEEDPPDGLANETDDAGNVVTDAWGNPIEGLTPGTVLYAPPGKTIAVHSPQPPSGVADYINACLHEVAAGVGLSYHVLSGDMSDSSFAQARLGLIEQAKNVAALREADFVPTALDPIWQAFINAAILADLLPDRPYPVRWSAPKQQSADRLDEARAAMLEMRLGLRSRPEIIEADGRDPDDVNAEIAADREAREALGIVSDGDPSQVTMSGAIQAVQAVSEKTEKP
jgi:lambda family phage portal protein